LSVCCLRESVALLSSEQASERAIHHNHYLPRAERLSLCVSLRLSLSSSRWRAVWRLLGAV